MTRKQALQKFGQDLHISHNQIFTYLSCSLKYKFHYVENRPAEKISIALPFGVAIHAALELYYRGLKKTGQPEPVDALVERFTQSLSLDLDNATVPVIFKKEMNRATTLDMGAAMLKAFYEECTVRPEQIIDVELPLSARLYTDDKEPTEFLLVGIIDLLVKGQDGKALVVDNKTAAKPMAQATADDDNQMTAYAYLLAANQYVFPTADVNCRFDILRKLKTPKLEQVETIRTADSRRRFAKRASAVLSAIDAGVYIPQPSWMCPDCSYQRACRDWHLSDR